MVALTRQESHQSRTALAGTWKLGAGRALTLEPRDAGLLRIAHGSVWVTGDGPHAGPPGDCGDRFLGAGEQLAMARGERLVIEPIVPGQPAYFSWEPVAQPQLLRPGLAELAQPVRDLRLALGLGLGAAGRLLVALAGVPSRSVARARPAFAARAPGAH
jgi:Protein of unknown function (DUF2917)